MVMVGWILVWVVVSLYSIPSPPAPHPTTTHLPIPVLLPIALGSGGGERVGAPEVQLEAQRQLQGRDEEGGVSIDGRLLGCVYMCVCHFLN